MNGQTKARGCVFARAGDLGFYGTDGRLRGSFATSSSALHNEGTNVVLDRVFDVCQERELHAADTTVALGDLDVAVVCQLKRCQKKAGNLELVARLHKIGELCRDSTFAMEPIKHVFAVHVDIKCFARSFTLEFGSNTVLPFLHSSCQTSLDRVSERQCRGRSGQYMGHCSVWSWYVAPENEKRVEVVGVVVLGVEGLRACATHC